MKIIAQSHLIAGAGHLGFPRYAHPSVKAAMLLGAKVEIKSPYSIDWRPADSESIKRIDEYVHTQYRAVVYD